MPLTLYQASVPAFERGLQVLADLLTKAKIHADAQGMDFSTLVNARLADNMYTLAGQVQSASDAAKAGTARLAQLAPPSFPDTETTFDELQARISKTLDFIAGVSAAQINASEGRSVIMKAGGKETAFASEPYLLGFVLPNFYFHITTAYDILRAQGVPLVKMDYLGSFDSLQAA